MCSHIATIDQDRVIPNYNVMGVAKASLEASVRYLAADLGPAGIRVNALSAGPIKTLAASGISGFGGMQRQHRNRAPLRKDTETEEVADAALFLLSPMSRGITGQVLYVDGGFNIMGDSPGLAPILAVVSRVSVASSPIQRGRHLPEPGPSILEFSMGSKRI